MSTKRKARPAVGAAGQAEREKHWASGNSQNDFTIWSGTIASLLLRGRENALPLQHLKTVTNLDGRAVRLMIERERRAGIPILADNLTGYFLPADAEERAEFVRSMRHRAQEIMKTAQAVEEGEPF